MTRRENIFLAKKLYVELVYNTAYIEGLNITFPQTQTIIDGGIVNNVSVTDIQTVLNLRDGWKYVLNSVDMPLNLDYICKVNSYVSRNESLEWGVLRRGKVGVSGTAFQPEIPVKENVVKELIKINNISDIKKRAIEYFCYAVRNQLFWDGNKRTSTMVSTKILIEGGEGVLTIGEANGLAFNEGLLDYYNTNDNRKLTSVLYKCIKTMDFVD